MEKMKSSACLRLPLRYSDLHDFVSLVFIDHSPCDLYALCTLCPDLVFIPYFLRDLLCR